MKHKINDRASVHEITLRRVSPDGSGVHVGCVLQQKATYFHMAVVSRIKERSFLTEKQINKQTELRFMKHKRHNIDYAASDIHGTHFPLRRPTQEGSAVTWSRIRDKSPLVAAAKMSGLLLIREVAAACEACKTNQRIRAPEWSCTIARNTRQQTTHLHLHGGMHGNALQQNRVNSSSE